MKISPLVKDCPVQHGDRVIALSIQCFYWECSVLDTLADSYRTILKNILCFIEWIESGKFTHLTNIILFNVRPWRIHHNNKKWYPYEKALWKSDKKWSQKDHLSHVVVMPPLQFWPLYLRCHSGQIIEKMCNTFAHHGISITHLISVNPKIDMQKIVTLDGLWVRADAREHFDKNTLNFKVTS